MSHSQPQQDMVYLFGEDNKGCKWCLKANALVVHQCKYESQLWLLLLGIFLRLLPDSLALGIAVAGVASAIRSQQEQLCAQASRVLCFCKTDELVA
ncbi:hypothetical protein ABBQ32_009710 [Trebouxia sp. C0010 RCD-2024]